MIAHLLCSACSMYPHPGAGRVHVQVANFTIDLGMEYEVQAITLRFNGIPPRTAALFASRVDGSTGQYVWEPYQLWAADCVGQFSVLPGPPASVAAVACALVPPSMTTFVFEPLASRSDGGLPYPRNSVLQRIATVRALRLSVTELFTSAQLADTFGNGTGDASADDVGLLMLAEMEITARCNCNGHASTCRAAINSTTPRRCECQHGTAGVTCERCAPLSNEKPWARGVSDTEPNECIDCNCHGRATSCMYNATLDPLPQQRYSGGGGVCACELPTTDRQCTTCVASYFLTSAVAENTTMCSSCNCDTDGTVNGDATACNPVSGQCACKTHASGRTCDSCAPGFYGLSGENPDGCLPCACDVRNTVNNSNICAPDTGQCLCASGYSGQNCSVCQVNHYAIAGDGNSASSLSCRPCDPQCDDSGCSGDGPAACFACRYVNSTAGHCVSECPSMQFMDQSTRQCSPCSQTCAGGCAAAGPSACDRCRLFRMASTGVCVDECPSNSYPDSTSTCQPCDASCARSVNSSRSCFGPGPSRCFACVGLAMLNGTCVSVTQGGTMCPTGTYRHSYGDPVCLPCHDACDSAHGCSGPGPFACNGCAAFAVVPITTAPTVAPTVAPTMTTTLAPVATSSPTTVAPTTEAPTSASPIAATASFAPVTDSPVTYAPATFSPSSRRTRPTTIAPTSRAPTTVAPTTISPTMATIPTQSPTVAPTAIPTVVPTTSPSAIPTMATTTMAPTEANLLCSLQCPNTGMFQGPSPFPSFAPWICMNCSSMCAGSCTGPGADQCVGGCSNYALLGAGGVTAECVSTCPTHTTAIDLPSGVGIAPFFLLASTRQRKERDSDAL